MLEILMLISLTKKVGGMAGEKGHNEGSWKLYTVLLWIGGEVVGYMIGASMFKPEADADGFNFAAYGIALLGAAAGALTAYTLAQRLENKAPPTDVFD